MKTIEEKAKAYDEAIGKAAALYKASEPMSGCNVIIETLFPEIKESEDEKIRKRLITDFGTIGKKEWGGLEVKDILAWLENIPYTIDHEKREGFHLGYKAGLERLEMKIAKESLGIDSDTYNKIIDECIFGEQKPNDKVEPKFKVGDKIQYLKGCGAIMTIEKIENGEYIFTNNMGHTTIENGNKCYLVERKPAEWHREDEQNLNACLGYIPDEFLRRWLMDVVYAKYDKPAWSEEDEELLKWSINNLTELKDRFGEEYGKVGKCIDWVKSLRPQNHWKPSSEQMKALNAINVIGVYLMQDKDKY